MTISESDEMREERLFGALLKRNFETVEADPSFRVSLLNKLKQSQATARQETEQSAVEAGDVGREDQWRRLLSTTYPPLSIRPAFKNELFEKMRTQIAQAKEDHAFNAILHRAFQPVQPSGDFQQSLLDKLKNKQREQVEARAYRRRRAVVTSLFTSLSAAAMVLFVVWLTPPDNNAYRAGGIAEPIPSAIRQTMPMAAVTANPDSPQVAEAVSTNGDWSVANAFAGSKLPNEVRGVGMEMNAGDGWIPMDENQSIPLAPGTHFRAVTNQSGLGFDGASLAFFPNAEAAATENGIQIQRGQVALKHSQDADKSFMITFPERDIAVQPGSILTVDVGRTELYAEGGGPSPEVKVLDGGFAVAKSKSGKAAGEVGPLLAGRAYRIDRYSTADMPSRPLSKEERKEFEPTVAQSPAPAGSYNASGLSMVSNTRVGPGFSARDSSAPLRPNTTMRRYMYDDKLNSFSIPTPVFTFDGDRWVQEGYVGQDTHKIRYLSPDYFKLAMDRRDLAPALEYGAKVIFNKGDGTYYEIYK